MLMLFLQLIFPQGAKKCMDAALSGKDSNTVWI